MSTKKERESCILSYVERKASIPTFLSFSLSCLSTYREEVVYQISDELNEFMVFFK